MCRQENAKVFVTKLKYFEINFNVNAYVMCQQENLMCRQVNAKVFVTKLKYFKINFNVNVYVMCQQEN